MDEGGYEGRAALRRLRKIISRVTTAAWSGMPDRRNFRVRAQA
jgi:hypothetical protein